MEAFLTEGWAKKFGSFSGHWEEVPKCSIVNCREGKRHPKFGVVIDSKSSEKAKLNTGGVLKILKVESKSAKFCTSANFLTFAHVCVGHRGSMKLGFPTKKLAISVDTAKLYKT